MYKDHYKMDVSIADDSDGLLPGNVNFKLPKKRPNEIGAGFLLNF